MGLWQCPMEVMGLDIYSFWKNKKVLITGLSGFKGSWLSFWLNQMGADVYGISLETEGNIDLYKDLSLAKELGSKNYIFDIRDKTKLAKTVDHIKPDITFHLAAQALVRESYNYPIKTWETNVIGTLNLLQSLTNENYPNAIVAITTDKVYKNNEWEFGYRETDELGGKDPYSASKAACEFAISSWRSSFCNYNSSSHNKNYLKIASARAGNVIGGGDWSKDRIVPDLIRSIKNKNKLILRNPYYTRPWQHVLEPLYGYLILGMKLIKDDNPPESAFNFGPTLKSNKTVLELVKHSFEEWPGEYIFDENKKHPNEEKLLSLQIEKSYQILKWEPTWDFNKTIKKTILWYKKNDEGASAKDCCLEDINDYVKELENKSKL